MKQRQTDAIAKFLAARADNLPSRRYHDPGWKRCPCLMHRERYYAEFGRQPPDEEEEHPHHRYHVHGKPNHNQIRQIHDYDGFGHVFSHNHMTGYTNDHYRFLKQKLQEKEKRELERKSRGSKENTDYNDIDEQVNDKKNYYYEPKKQFEGLDRLDWDPFF